MYLFVVILIGPLIAAMASTGTLFHQVETLERRQIAIDNAAVALGRGDRLALQAVVDANRALEALELAHHSAHACARLPTPAAPECEATDLALEAEIFAAQSAARRTIALLWKTSETRARLAFHALEPRRHFLLDRLNTPPVRDHRCPICGLLAGFELVPRGPLSWHLSEAKGELEAHARLDGRSAGAAGNWNYRVCPKPCGASL